MYGVANLNLLKEQKHFHKLLGDTKIQQGLPYQDIPTKHVMTDFY